MNSESNNESSSKPGRFQELESLRGLAAMSVLLYHLPEWNPVLDVGFRKHSYLMVEFFFVLSGFVICKAYGKKIATIRDLARFQYLRFWRMYPVHILFLVAFAVMQVLKHAFLEPGTGEHLPVGGGGLAAFVQQVLLLQAIGPTGNNLTYNVPAWSISVEFYTYLVFGVTLLASRKLSTSAFAAIFIAAMSLVVLAETYGFGDMLRCMAGFSVGACLREYLMVSCQS